MQFGFGVPTRGPLAEPETIAAMIEKGEALGYSIATASDHVVVPRDIAARYPYSDSGEFPGGDTGECMDQLALLAFVAGRMTKMRLLTSVMVVPHRQPILAAKMLATIDVLSGGRLLLGCGTGWMEEEFAALQTAPYAERGKVTDEYIRIFKELWTSDDPKFQGDYASFSNVAFLPKPQARPHPPIWVGGESKAALRRVARLGDVWYPIGINPKHPLDTHDLFAARLADLRDVGEAEGRDPAGIGVAYNAIWYDETKEVRAFDGGRRIFTGSTAAVADDVGRMEEAGVTDIILRFADNDLARVEERMERFMKEVAGRA